MGKLFGTDGIRGVANATPVTPDNCVRLGRALGVVARRHGGSVILARDTRRSGPMLEAALCAGLCSAGLEVQLAGVLPTPAIAALTVRHGFAAGIVVSASHNPFADNGIKIFGGDGFKLSDDHEAEIEGYVLQSGAAPEALPTGAGVGVIQRYENAVAEYVDGLLATVADRDRLADLDVVVDAAHGAAVTSARWLAERLGWRAHEIASQPDGQNINAGCGAVHPERLAHAVVERRAAAGIALDGDADRLAMVDEQGGVLDGDEILAILAADRAERGALRVPYVVGTVMSNLGLEMSLRSHGIALRRTPVGDRYVVEEMRRCGAGLGGESSGHIVLLDHATSGDGLLAALQVLAVSRRHAVPLSELRRVIAKCPQVVVNVRVTERRPLELVPRIGAAIAEVEGRLHDRGRVLVRYSGTEPLVRVMVEGQDASDVRRYAEQIGAVVRESLGTAQG